jgi:hypothetical protein
VLDSGDPELWVRTIVNLIADEPHRLRMGAAAHEAMQKMSFRASFEHFWAEHERAWHDNTRGTAAERRRGELLAG